jgi:multidrug transporter EmrE-like cation transporter
MIKAIIFCFFYALLNVSGAALIKWKLKGRVLNELSDWIKFLFDIQVIGAFALIFCSALILFKALSAGNFTFIIPVSAGINFILTVIAGYYIFKDHINMASFIGFTLIISGIIILSINTAHYAK